MNEENDGLMNAVGSFLGKLATPLAENLAYGGETASELALYRARVEAARANGSGPNDLTRASGAFQTLQDWLFSEPVNVGGLNFKGALLPMAIVLGVGMILLYAVRR